MEKRRELVDFSRKLRRSQTEAEKALWRKLRNRQLAGVKFRRQQPIGPFVVDFACLARDLVIELDGGQHGEKIIEKKDKDRTLWLEQRGYRVLRFWDNEVLMDIEGVLERISMALD